MTYRIGVIGYRPDGGTERLADQRLAILECGYCQQNIVVIEEELHDGIRGKQSGSISWRGIHWWPPPGGGMLGPDVPQTISGAYDEGIRCLSANAPNGAAAMFRAAIAYLVDDKGSDEAKGKRNLADKITQMAKDGGLPPALIEWATQVRFSGNAGAHPDVYGDVTMEDARDVARLISTFVDVMYTVPAKIARQRAGGPKR